MIRPLARPAALAAALLTAPLLTVPLALPAGATTPPPTPAYAAGSSVQSGRLHVVYRQTDGRVVLRALTDGYSQPADVGGSVSTSPSIVVRNVPGNEILVVAAGTNGAVYRRPGDYDEGWNWAPWQSVGGYTTSAPTVSCSGVGGGAPVIWIRGGDGALWRRGAETPWQKLGGAITSAPSAAGTLDGACPTEEYVVARGTDKAVWEFRAGGWHKVGGASNFAPAIVRGINKSYVFVVGTDGALFLASRSTDGAPWSAFRRLGGKFTSAPTATLWSQFGDQYVPTVLALGGNGQLYRATQDEDTPGPWPFVPFG